MEKVQEKKIISIYYSPSSKPYSVEPFLDSFPNLQKAAISFIMSDCLLGTTQLLLDGSS
jgi:hypothetical protein